MEPLRKKEKEVLTFSGFAQMLHPLLGGRAKAPEFVLALIDHIMEEPFTDQDKQSAQEDRYNPLAALSVSTLGKYYNGARSLSREGARAVLNRLDMDKFSGFIQEAPVDTVQMLGEVMAAKGIAAGKDVDEIARTCTEQFARILQAHAEQTPALALTVIRGKEDLREEVEDGGGHESDLFLLMEANGRCPVCAKLLTGQKDRQNLAEYRVMEIFPRETGQAQDCGGKIALCLSCANRYAAHTGPEDYKWLQGIKNRLQRDYQAAVLTDRVYLEEQVEQLIRRIGCAPPGELKDTLSYKALCVREKICPEQMPLIVKVEGYVVSYYRFIQSVFAELEGEGALNFNCVAEDVASCYRRLGSLGLSQEEVFNRLARWFGQKTQSDCPAACEILVAFFVQNCEVFHAVAQ